MPLPENQTEEEMDNDMLAKIRVIARGLGVGFEIEGLELHCGRTLI